MNPYSNVTHSKEHEIFEAGGSDMLLDIFDYLTGNPNLLDSPNFGRIQKMMAQAKQDIKIPVEV